MQGRWVESKLNEQRPRAPAQCEWRASKIVRSVLSVCEAARQAPSPLRSPRSNAPAQLLHVVEVDSCSCRPTVLLQLLGPIPYPGPDPSLPTPSRGLIGSQSSSHDARWSPSGLLGRDSTRNSILGSIVMRQKGCEGKRKG
eukprot:1669398-Rhodomonas_salina.1